jgi:hypothetical protein
VNIGFLREVLIMQRLARPAVLGVLVLSLGCSRLQTTSVSGVVRFQGQPLAGGTVTFVDTDNQKRHSAIGKDGRYRVEGPAPGTARIVVVSHPRVPEGFNPARPGQPGGKAAEEKRDNVPKRYADVETSGLSVVVSGGKQTHDIDLGP